MLSSGVYGWLPAAVERSEFSALSAAVWLSPFEQANARAAAGSISSFLNILKPPVLTTAQRDGTSITGRVYANNGVLSLIHISEPTRLLSISYAVFCLK